MYPTFCSHMDTVHQIVNKYTAQSVLSEAINQYLKKEDIMDNTTINIKNVEVQDQTTIREETMSERIFLIRKEGVTSFKELCSYNPIVVDCANGKEIWDSEFDPTMWTRFMDYWNIDRSVHQTSAPGFDDLVAYKLDESEMDLQQQAASKDN